MAAETSRPPAALVIGSRGLGRAVARVLRDAGWAVAGGARSAGSLDRVRADGCTAVTVDVADRASVDSALRRAAAELGGLDLVVNAAGSYGGEVRGPFGGGPTVEADEAAFEAWAAAPARTAFTFLSSAGAFLLRRHEEAGRADAGSAAGGRVPTLVQVTGGSARRPIGGRPLWAAGAAGVRALTLGTALDLRPRGVHVALLVVDGQIAPIDEVDRDPAAIAPEAVDPYAAGEAVRVLADQPGGAATHELVVTPLAEPFTP